MSVVHGFSGGGLARAIHSQRGKILHKLNICCTHARTTWCTGRRTRKRQSFQFLLDVSEFRSSSRQAQDPGGRSDDYGDFLRIVTEYIKVNSSSEVNIDSTTRNAILAFSERSEYESLDAVRKGEFAEGSSCVAANTRLRFDL